MGYRLISLQHWNSTERASRCGLESGPWSYASVQKCLLYYRERQIQTRNQNGLCEVWARIWPQIPRSQQYCLLATRCLCRWSSCPLGKRQWDEILHTASFSSPWDLCRSSDLEHSLLGGILVLWPRKAPRRVPSSWGRRPHSWMPPRWRPGRKLSPKRYTRGMTRCCKWWHLRWRSCRPLRAPRVPAF